MNKSERRYDEQEAELPNSCVRPNQFNSMIQKDATSGREQRLTHGINGIVAQRKANYFGEGSQQ